MTDVNVPGERSDGTHPELSVRVLGSVGLAVGDRAVPLPGRRLRAVLAALTVGRRHAVSTESLADRVWNGDPPATAATGLQVAVSGIRKAVREAGGEPERALRTVAQGYLLDLAETAVDAGRFELYRSAGATAATPDEAAEHYRRALAQWAGEPLADLRGLRFADEFATALGESRLQVLGARIDADIACGRASAVIPELVALTGEHPLREPLWAQLIRALYLAGRQSDALDAGRRIRANLNDELGIDPGPELIELERRVLRQEPLDDGPRAERFAAGSVTIVDAVFDPPAGRLRLADGRIVFAANGLRIGRAPDNDVRLEAPNVSRYHARVEHDADGTRIRDLDSRNGVYVDGERITGSATLLDGTRIRIGPVTMTFEQR